MHLIESRGHNYKGIRHSNGNNKHSKITPRNLIFKKVPEHLT